MPYQTDLLLESYLDKVQTEPDPDQEDDLDPSDTTPAEGCCHN